MVQVLLEILDVLYLAWLGHAVPLFLKSPSPIKLHYFLIVTEYPHKQEKTAYYGTCAPFPVVTVEYCNSFGVCCQKVCNFIADNKEGIKGRSFVVLPLEI